MNVKGLVVLLLLAIIGGSLLGLTIANMVNSHPILKTKVDQVVVEKKEIIPSSLTPYFINPGSTKSIGLKENPESYKIQFQINGAKVEEQVNKELLISLMREL